MNPDDINALVMAIIVVSVILGFTMYFNNPSLNKAWSSTNKKTKAWSQCGVHSPEFEFEKNYANVKGAVQRFGITHPVMADWNGRKSYHNYDQAQYDSVPAN